MKVDKARFLFLTTAISAATAVAVTGSGCTVTSTNTPDTDRPPVTTDDAGTDASVVDAYVAEDGATTDAAASCLDDTGLTPTCAGVPTTCSTICEHYIPTFKAGVARAIVACLTTLPTCEGTETDIANCVQNALGAACPDPTAEGFCQPLSDGCGAGDAGDAGPAALPLSECTDVATGLNDTGRTAFTACLNDGQGANYCKADPGTCLEAIE